jgi:hypothetical protein
MVVSIRKMALWFMTKSVLLSVFIRILFPECEGRMFIQNVDNHLPGYALFTILHTVPKLERFYVYFIHADGNRIIT